MDMQGQIEALYALSALAQAQAAGAAALEFAVTFVYRPGDPGPLAPNVFTDWNTLYARMIQVEGFKVIGIQDDFAVPVIPAGIYNLRGVTIQSSFDTPSGSPVQCELDDGVVFLNFREIRNNITLNSHATTVPVFTMGTEPLIIEKGAGLKSDAAATVPFIHVPAGGGTGPIVLLSGGTFGGPGPASPTALVDAGANLGIILDLVAGLANDTVIGLGSLLIIVGSQSAFVNTPFPISQAGIGTLVVNIFSYAQLTQVDGLTAVLNPADWVGPKPTNVLDALNRMAATVAALNAGPIP